MKVLGRGSIASFVEKFLIVLLVLCVIALITGLVIGLVNWESIRSNLMIATILGIIYLSGFPALLLITAFINIFNALKKEEVFSLKNGKHLKTAYVTSMIIGVMYVINALLIIVIPYITEKEITWEIGIGMFYALAVAMVFLIFSVGLIVLNQIYEKAIEYKQENELTI